MDKITEVIRASGIGFMTDFSEDSDNIDPHILETDHAGRYFSGENTRLNRFVYPGTGIRSSMKMA